MQSGALPVDEGFETSRPGMFACGDATRGASLVVWAIWEGREVAHSVDVYLMGESRLPTLPNPSPNLTASHPLFAFAFRIAGILTAVRDWPSLEG